MPRQPTKNHINMHDIIEQPLTALPDAVDAILRRPEPLDDVEVHSIFYESSFILLRAEEALSIHDGEAFCALFKLFSEGFAHSDTLFEEGIKTFTLNHTLLESVHTIFSVVVEQRQLPLHSTGTIELVQVISNLCDGEALKDKCGAFFMASLAQVLVWIYEDAGEAVRHVRTQRGAATALINLVKGSKANKLRLPSWKFIADCCVASVDVFFQLQCIELLFRVSRQNKCVFGQLDATFSEGTLNKLRGLPNDGTLLAKMMRLVEDLNVDRLQVLRFSLSQVDVADTALTGKTEAYFTPYYFIVMVTSSNVDNITTPYRMIRSITLGKDGRVIIRLEEFPVKLESILSYTAGMDTVTLHMTVERLRGFKQSPIRTWIVAELTAKKSAALSLPQRVKSQDRASSKRRLADDTQPAGPEKLTPAMQSTAVSIDDAKDKPPVYSVAANSSNLTKTLPSAIDDVALSMSTDKEARAIGAQLKKLIDTEIEIRRGESVPALNKMLASIQSKVDDARHMGMESRAAWEQEMTAEIEQVEQYVRETQDAVATSVTRLNNDLYHMKQSNQSLNERIACIEVELQRVLEESRMLEQQDVEALRSTFRKEVERQEFALDQRLLDRDNGTMSLSNYLSAASARDGL